MYVAGFVIPVPADNLDAYKDWAVQSAALLKSCGCLEIVESWEDNVPDGRQTDFRRAVAAKPGEKIVFTWQVWPDRATVDAAEARMAADPVFESLGDPPFDPSRLITGGFRPLYAFGRG